MFDGLFQTDTDRALAIEAENPRATPKKPPGFFTGMGTALVEGPIQGALESGRVITNVLAEYGKAAAFREGAAPAESIDRMFTTEDPNAKELGRLAKKYDPDPETSSTAAQIVHGFGKFATKVVGAVATAGPAAPLVVGVDEGVSEGLRLSDKGVDAGTATLAGAARGTATAAAVALPIAGRTILQTVGLAAAGGPGAFIAEQATIREILRDADYQTQAAEYDPFDVLGLVVSTAAPLTFGAAAHLMRGRRAAAPAAPAAAPVAPKPPDEVVDAARVELLNQHDMALVQGTGPEAVQAHAEGRAMAVERIERGEPAVVADTGPAVLQNRDRSTTASVAQMQAIAAEPDYLRLSPGRQLAEGTPVVIAEAEVPAAQLGGRDVAVDARGGRVDVQYAVVEAEQLLGSHNASGIANPAYGTGAAGQLRAVAGNARVAGLQRGYEMGTTAAYREALAADASHGIAADVIKGMKRPVLVRLMSADQVTADIGDRTNVAGVSDLSPVDQAANDARRVKFESLEFEDDGSPTPDAVRRFVLGMPEPEQAGLINKSGAPTRQAIDRLMAATFKKAYGDDDLVDLYAAAIDPEARNVISALGQAAGSMARLEGAGDLDIRQAVVDAAKLAVNARRSGVKLEVFAKQVDIESDPFSTAIVQIFARNPRSPKKIATDLQDLAEFVAKQAEAPAEDIFGPVARATRGDILARLTGDESPSAKLAREVEAEGVKFGATPEQMGGLVEHMRQAEAAKTDFDAGVKVIAEAVDGNPMIPGLKGIVRSVEKMMLDYAGDAKRLKDIVRATVEIKTIDSVDQALAVTRAQFGEPIGLRNTLAEGSAPTAPDGYRDVKMNVVVNGHEAELQINVPEMLEAKGEAHKLYEEARSIEGRIFSEKRDATPEEAARLEVLQAEQRAIYGAAWDRAITNATIARKASSDTSAPLWENDDPGNLRPSGTSQARTAQSGVLETGTPSTSANSVPAGKEAGSGIESTSDVIIARDAPEQDVSVRAALQAIEARGDFEIELEDGTRVSARQAMADAAAAVKQAETDSQAFRAAVECALGS